MTEEAPKSKLGKIIGRDIDYDVDQLMEDMDWMLLLIFTCACLLVGATDGSWFFTFDGTWRPFFGKGRRYGKNAKKVHDGEISMVARRATPHVRDKSRDKSKPMPGPVTPGTILKLDQTQINAHFYGWTKPTFPLRFRPGPMVEDTLQAFVEAIKDAPCKPLIGFADRESGNQKKTQPFRDELDALGIGIMFSLRKDDTTKRIIIDHWNTHKAQPIPSVGRIRGGPRVVFWSVAYRVWNEAAEQFYNMLILYYDRNPQKQQTDPEESATPLQLGRNLWATCHVINFDVPEDLARWAFSQVKCYWSCENLHQRTKRHGGLAGGDTNLGRDVIYGAVQTHLGLLALWRVERTRRLEAEGVSRGRIKRLVSHTRFFGAVRRHLDDFFRRRNGL